MIFPGSRFKFGEEVSKRELLALLFLSLLIEILQSRFLPHFLHVHLFLIVVLYTGWSSAPLRGGLVGTLFGLVNDYWLGIYLGLNGLSKTLIGYGAAYLSQLVATDLGAIRGVLIALLSLLDQLLVVGLLLLLGENWPQIALYEMVISAILTGFVGEIFCRSYDKIRFPPADFRRR